MSSIPSAAPLTRTTGFWLAAIIALLQAVNAGRAAIDPIGFAAYMGVSAGSGEPLAWVYIYGLRAGFMALLVILLLLNRQITALSWTALAGLVMPLGDAWIAAGADASPLIVARHLAVAAYLALASYFLRRAARTTMPERIA